MESLFETVPHAAQEANLVLNLYAVILNRKDKLADAAFGGLVVMEFRDEIFAISEEPVVSLFPILERRAEDSKYSLDAQISSSESC